MVDPGNQTERRALERTISSIVGSSREARWILDDATGGAGSGDHLSAETTDRVRQIAARRHRGEPLQYLLGHWPFRELDLAVDRRALIPRPETEWVTDVALAELDRLIGQGATGKVVDLGTGTGAIALSIAVERVAHDVEVVATDRDPDALELARINRERVTLQRVGRAIELRQGAWWEALEGSDRGRILLAVSNPPYVAAVDWELLDPVVRDHEPYGALVSPDGTEGTAGFADIETILAGAKEWLGRPGGVVLEIAPYQEAAAIKCARRSGSPDARVLPDLSGRPRALVARFG